MQQIQQRRDQCSIAALCVLNEFSQADYEALADLLSAHIEGYDSKPHKFIPQAIKIARNLGMTIPQGYLDGLTNLWPTAQSEQFKGKGIAWIRIAPNTHVIAYENGVFFDSDPHKMQFASWEDMRVYFRDNHNKRIKLIKTYPLS